MSIKWLISDIDYIIWWLGTVNIQEEHWLPESKNRFNVHFISRKNYELFPFFDSVRNFTAATSSDLKSAQKIHKESVKSRSLHLIWKKDLFLEGFLGVSLGSGSKKIQENIIELFLLE